MSHSRALISNAIVEAIDHIEELADRYNDEGGPVNSYCPHCRNAPIHLRNMPKCILCLLRDALAAIGHSKAIIVNAITETIEHIEELADKYNEERCPVDSFCAHCQNAPVPMGTMPKCVLCLLNEALAALFFAADWGVEDEPQKIASNAKPEEGSRDDVPF